MSAPRSKYTKMLMKADAQTQRYQVSIDRQKRIIDRLVLANAVQGDALVAVEEESKDIRQARKVAKEARAKVKSILAVPEVEGIEHE